MKVKEVAELVGISVRTLHHYDEIGLLKPDNTTESGYRIYSQENLESLQQILFFKELGFPLKKIKEIISSPTFDQQEALKLHKKMLEDKRKRIDQMIRTIEKTMKHSKGEIKMSNKEKFDGFDFSNNPYEQEARERWGDEAIDESNAKINNMSTAQQKKMGEDFDAIYKELAAIRHQPADSQIAQQTIERWYEYLNKIGSYSLEAFKGLGQMYVDDVRFTKNIDKYGDGLAVFMRDAMAVYADKNQ
ncbi:transcriptional regulator, MerR family [Oceanobacillus limi]|uniref:Transcriptional regulator, MerR family n=1 Tax=Oceanobacillus limi TaxID=930131 RepID=A0A1I0B1M6_9BACI|nr:MerR family transcriptional regulator [Oceanobacillus limi]SET00643.1 transcriptional regulator, MerR family [Oceanobacillus limi]